VRVEVWSDVVCPWCYIGKRNLEAALAASAAEFAGNVELVWRSYELDPHAPAVRDEDYLSRLARKYETDIDGARAMVDRMVRAASAAGLEFKLDIARGGNTFDAHRLIHAGGGGVKERLMRAYFMEGEPIGSRDVLARLAVEAGMSSGAVEDVLASDAYAVDVRADEARAAAMGVQGVPFFLIDEAYGIAGAQPPEVLGNLLRRAWDESVR
jgi:predicted DsbA family dithiol-disulfide isomerase